MRDDAPFLEFRKMHGLGNDFVVVDRRGGRGAVAPDLARAMGDRRTGVGFDQMAVIADDAEATAALVFLNADGSEAGACGNATRCVARLLMDEAGARAVTLRTARGTLACEEAGEAPAPGPGHRGAGGAVRVNMGPPLTGWREVPLAEPCDTLRLPLPGEPAACSMGNPHCTFVVPDAEAVDPATLSAYETHPLFPERTNVQAVSVRGDRLRVRVWERGVGVTPASGSSACAAAVACARLGLAPRTVAVALDGGELAIDWREDGVRMTGPTAHVFDGAWRLA